MGTADQNNINQAFDVLESELAEVFGLNP